MEALEPMLKQAENFFGGRIFFLHSHNFNFFIWQYLPWKETTRQRSQVKKGLKKSKSNNNKEINVNRNVKVKLSVSKNVEYIYGKEKFNRKHTYQSFSNAVMKYLKSENNILYKTIQLELPAYGARSCRFC